MAQVMILVIDDPGKVEDLIYEWIDAGVDGVTIFDSSGWTQRLGTRGFRLDQPRLRSVRSLLLGRQPDNRTILSVVEDEFDIPQVIDRTEAVLGPLDEPGTGIFVALQASHGLGSALGMITPSQ